MERAPGSTITLHFVGAEARKKSSARRPVRAAIACKHAVVRLRDFVSASFRFPMCRLHCPRLVRGESVSVRGMSMRPELKAPVGLVVECWRGRRLEKI